MLNPLLLHHSQATHPCVYFSLKAQMRFPLNKWAAYCKLCVLLLSPYSCCWIFGFFPLSQFPFHLQSSLPAPLFKPATPISTFCGLGSYSLFWSSFRAANGSERSFWLLIPSVTWRQISQSLPGASSLPTIMFLSVISIQNDRYSIPLCYPLLFIVPL